MTAKNQITTNHDFTVHVSGCTSEQAEKVMSERIDPDEDFGFDYIIGWEATNSPVAGLVIDDSQKKIILKALKQSLSDTQDDRAGYPQNPRSKKLAADCEKLDHKCKELKELIALVKTSTPATAAKD